MERMDRPRVDAIENIPPAIAIDRKDPVRTSRSTVGTMTELTDYVKLLYARMGQLHCKGCGRAVSSETPQQAWQALADYPEGSEVIITFPIDIAGGESDTIRKKMVRLGFDRFYLSGRIRHLTEWQPPKGANQLDILADRLLLKTSDRRRIIDSLEQAFGFGNGSVDLRINSGGRPVDRDNADGHDHHLRFSSRIECAQCNIAYGESGPNLFSFNSPVGACDTCRGFGRTIDIDLDLIIPDHNLSLEEGAIKPWGSREDPRMEFKDLRTFCRRRNIPMDIPFKHLSGAQKTDVIDGTGKYYGVRGFFQWLETKTYKMHVRVYLARYRSYTICRKCNGTRFKQGALLYRLGGLNIGQLYALSVDDARAFFKTSQFPGADAAGKLLLSEIRSRLKYLRDVGLGYLTLDRQSRTLSGGEVQRVALTSALGSSLVNALYILDEPSIGLHPRDNHRLIRILKGLKDLENTVVVVEHDRDIINSSDFVLDLGPRAGEGGGRVMYHGPLNRISDTLTGRYLNGHQCVHVPEKRRKPCKGKWLTVKGASEHNLKSIEINIPLGLLVCLTGVSGSGKSTLAQEILYKGMKRLCGDPQGRPGRFRSIRGAGNIHDVLLIDQKPIGRTPRANPLTYTKAMDPVRKLFAENAVSSGCLSDLSGLPGQAL
jgi:excinuclease ABC subunit A